MLENITPTLLWDLIKHLRSWLANLSRAGDARKQQSINALRSTIVAARETAVYMRELQENGRRDHAREGHLTVLWTELGFALEDLGISGLAKRCNITGKYWSDPTYFDKDFVDKADVSLERMEQLAREILACIR